MYSSHDASLAPSLPAHFPAQLRLSRGAYEIRWCSVLRVGEGVCSRGEMLKSSGRKVGLTGRKLKEICMVDPLRNRRKSGVILTQILYTCVWPCFYTCFLKEKGKEKDRVRSDWGVTPDLAQEKGFCTGPQREWKLYLLQDSFSTSV